MADTGRSTYLGLDEWPYSPKFQKFAHFLGLSAEKDAKGVFFDRRLGKKLEELYVWAKKRTGSEDDLDIYTAVKQLQMDLGYTERGESLIHRLWQYIQLDSKTLELDREKQRVEQEKELLSDKSQEQPKSPETQEIPETEEVSA